MASPNRNIYRPGQKAEMAGISVTILAACLRGRELHLEYHVAYVDESERRDVWIDSSELSIGDGETVKLGFFDTGHRGAGSAHRDDGGGAVNERE